MRSWVWSGLLIAPLLAACAHTRPAVQSIAAAASGAGPPLQVACQDWKRESDGGWSARRPTRIDGRAGFTIDQKEILKDVVVLRGRDLVFDLDAECGRAPRSRWRGASTLRRDGQGSG